MSTKQIYITDVDLKRLTGIVKNTKNLTEIGKNDAETLKKELERAIVTDSKKISKDVVTMNSVAKVIDMETGKEMTWRLVYPEYEDIKHGRLSILAPLGMALLGYSKGDVFEWRLPVGLKKIMIKDVLYQPEASGHFNL
jgi:regulator of nucleoside diphosphate kinase